jgi:hypothetical protein
MRSGVGNQHGNAMWLSKKTNLVEKKRLPNFIGLAGQGLKIWRPPNFILQKTRFGSRFERRISPKKKLSGGFTAVTQCLKMLLLGTAFPS